jgi:hypothetical protein
MAFTDFVGACLISTAASAAGLFLLCDLIPVQFARVASTAAVGRTP